jgi:ATP synthase protein I
VNSSNSQDNPNNLIDSEPVSESIQNEEKSNSMDEYYKLRQSIFLVTLSLTAVIFFVVWVSLSLNIALSYLLGACVGIVYLRMLAKDVEKISSEAQRVSSGRLAVFVGVIVLSARWDQLSIMPVFLGFLTYKIAIIGYVLLINLMPAQNR